MGLVSCGECCLPVKNFSFIYFSSVRLLNASPFGYQWGTIWGPVLLEAAANAGASDMCSNSFQKDASFLLE